MLARGAHDVGGQVETLQRFKVDLQEAGTGRMKVDLAFAGLGSARDAGARHAGGEADRRVVFVHEFAFRQAFVLHVDAVAAHLLQPADIAGGYGLSGQEFRALALAGFDAFSR